MTTTIRVEAHCASNIEVVVSVLDGTSGNGASLNRFVLQGGETGTYYVYDARKLTVRERVKEPENGSAPA